jgi:hypothetical protein
VLEKLLNHKRNTIISQRGRGIEDHPEHYFDDIRAYDQETVLQHLVHHLPDDPNVDKQYTRKAVWVRTLIKRMGYDKVLENGLTDSQLSKLYLNTDDKVYLENMKGSLGLEHTFAQELGL